MIVNARGAATELVDVYGAGAKQRLLQLESEALARRAITEYFYWKLVGEYVRERNNSGRNKTEAGKKLKNT